MTRRRDEDDLPMSRVQPVEEDVRRELEFHLEQRAAELEAGGMSAEQAMAVARQAFGDREGIELACRAIETRRRGAKRRIRQREALRQDIALGLRVLRRSPAFTLAAIATLALGVGANTAVFSIVNKVILQPLAFRDSDRLIHLVERHEKGWADLAWANFVDVHAQAHSFNGLAAYTSGVATVLGAQTPLQLHAAVVSSDFFRVFPVRPTLGRVPLPDEHVKGAPPVALVSYSLWRDQLGSPASLDGVHLKLDKEYSVVGVLPPGFDFPEASQVWTPVELLDLSPSRTAHNFEVAGRLRPGLRPEDAQRDVDAVLARLKPLSPGDFDAIGSTVVPLQEELTRDVRTPLYLLLGASGFLLLAACTNLAGALLARGTARANEFAVRSALGATQSRLVRQLLTESGLLAVLGCAAGILIASLLLRALVLFAPDSLPILGAHIDGRVLGFALLSTVTTTLLFGVLPALRLSGGASSGALRQGSRGTSDGARLRLWNGLVATEVAFAVALLAGSGLLIRSFAKVMDIELGFNPGQVVTAQVTLPPINYDGASPAIAAFHTRVLERLSATPGISAVGFANTLPLEGDGASGSLEVEGKPLGPTGRSNAYALYRVVGGDYFRAMGIPIVRGRAFGPGDDRTSPRVVIVSEDFAKAEWPNDDAVGKRLRPAGMDASDEPWATVIGVAGSVRARGVTGRLQETYYFPNEQRPAFRSNDVSYVVRSPFQAGDVAAIARRAIDNVDPQVPMSVRPFSAILDSSVADRRFTMLVLAAFAAVSVVLAIVGIHAVVSYSVAQRTREIGVRLALGATPGGVRSMVVASAMRAAAPGLALGAMIAVADARALRALVFGVSPLDPAALGGSLTALALAALLSSLLPARRATRVSPMSAIRAD